MQSDPDPLARGAGRKRDFGVTCNDPVIDGSAAGAEHIGIPRDRLVDVFDPIAAGAVGDLPPPAGQMAETGGEIGLVRAREHHAALAVLVTILHRKALHRMVPQHAPSTALGDGNAADLGAVGQGGGQNAGLDGRNGEEEGRKPSSESADHGRRWSGTVAPASSK